MRPDREGPADEQAGPFDPLSDLLFGLVAIIIPIFALLLPAMYMAKDTSPDEGIGARLMHAELRVHGALPQRFVAGAKGLHIPGEPAQFIPVDQVLGADAVAAELRGARERQQPVLLMIEPDGLETAFLFEAAAAHAGQQGFFQLRLDPACAFIRDAKLAATSLAASCVPQGRP
jgi:hypothetical protein